MCVSTEHPAGDGILRGATGRQEEGILLLEALIGLAIIGIVTISLLAATVSQVRSAGKADVLLTAAALAQDRLAAIQFLDQEGFSRPPDSLLAGTFPAPFDEFTWTAEVEESDGEYDLYAVSIIVTGRGEWFPLETLLHRPPLTAQVAEGGGMGAGGRMGGRGGRGEGGDRGSGGRMGPGGERTVRDMGIGRSYRGSGRTAPPGGQGTGRVPPPLRPPPTPPPPVTPPPDDPSGSLTEGGTP